MLTVVGTLAFDTLARVQALPSKEETGGVLDLVADAPGGTAGNVAVALARLGAPPRLLAAVGPDFAASPYAATLAAEGVDVRAHVVPSASTSRAYVFYDGHGGQVTYFHPGASSQFRADPAAVAGERVHFCAGEIARYPPLMEAAGWVSFDPGQELFHRPFEDVAACLDHVDVLFLNRHELRVMENHGWGLRRFFQAGATAVVETRSGEGTLVHSATGRFAAPAAPVRAVDPTGAGDAHRAGFLYALERTSDLGAAARFANVVASFAVEHVGAQTGLPRLEEALARYEKSFGGRPFAMSRS